MINYITQNSNMESEIERLKERTSNLGTLRQTLKDIHEMESAAVDHLEKSMGDRQEAMELNQTNLFTAIVDNVIDILLKLDKDEDMLLSDNEVNAIIKAIEGINEVDIKDDYLRQKINEYGSSIEGVMRLMNHIFDKTPSIEDYLNVENEQ
mmetsp:Transcript_7269/g.9007  ORF Transcript_7269/g.9007 Transcript_7269/m.9007 type:complete len:151 (+) Transcript_7269:25-477(+)